VAAVGVSSAATGASSKGQAAYVRLALCGTAGVSTCVEPGA